MFLLSNKKTRDLFRKSERKYRYGVGIIIFLTLTVLLCYISDAEFFNWSLATSNHALLIWELKSWMLLILNQVSGMYLLYILKRKYYFEYKVQRVAIISFLLLENSLNFLFVFQNFLAISQHFVFLKQFKTGIKLFLGLLQQSGLRNSI